MRSTRITKLSPDQQRLVELVSEAAAIVAGFYVTEEEAKQRKLLWPTPTQLNNNPANLSVWGSHQVRHGLVHFMPDVASELPKDHNGWKAARKQFERCIFDRHFTFSELFIGRGSLAPAQALRVDLTAEETASAVLGALKELASGDERVQQASIGTVISSLV